MTLCDVGRIATLSAAILASFGSMYWAHFRAPQLVIFPLFLVADLIAPIIVGFMFFKEHRKFSPLQLVYLGIAVTGGTFVALTMVS
jgi:uncharacterized integral membrane protein